MDDPNSNEVLIKTVALGICHSDIEFKDGRAPIQLPVILGHEGAGIVEKVGPNVTDFKQDCQNIGIFF
ncbi:alcohol dehydrogenase catalytic domain-containing protein [Lactobacillus xylocopicola]|uniref:Alcohol dehydrogenase n=1 Tax=Lactobacillus xylocopicola TaxID=2976676 RepID=A0ABM8BIP8_9LACO|nr:alcohol dehydrogenase catalytic domain-containing protein [Lactobacillus xylocopicola]BDR61182.1 hypothetical protein KIM322_14430 [Lactobacillus xylocopicola]